MHKVKLLPILPFITPYNWEKEVRTPDHLNFPICSSLKLKSQDPKAGRALSRAVPTLLQPLMALAQCMEQLMPLPAGNTEPIAPLSWAPSTICCPYEPNESLLPDVYSRPCENHPTHREIDPTHEEGDSPAFPRHLFHHLSHTHCPEILFCLPNTIGWRHFLFLTTQRDSST